jgi:probable HAF family extracellular repeat protein
MHDLGVLYVSDTYSIATGINNLGEVVGYSASHAFLWTQREGMLDLGTLPGDVLAGAFAINDSEQIVGTSVDRDGSQHAFFWTRSGGMQNLGTLGGTHTAADAINGSGQVVGSSYLSDNQTQRAFLWTQTDGIRNLGTLGGNSVALGVNDVGQVVGESQNSIAQVPFLWDSTHGMRSLGTVRQSVSTAASGINNAGQVVGAFSTSNPPFVAFLWTRFTGLQNLNTLVTHGSPWVGYANAINSSGQIVGQSGVPHALLLTPTKQPSSQRSKP